MDKDNYKDEISLSQSRRQNKKYGYGALAAIVITIGIYIFSQLLAGILVSLYPAARGWDVIKINNWLQSSVYGQFFFVFLVEMISVYSVYIFLRYRKMRLYDIGLKRPQVRDIVYAVIGILVYVLAYITIFVILQHFLPQLNSSQKQELGFSTRSSGFPLFLTFISLVILPPIAEEILTRGFLYTGLRKQMPKVVAALVTSALFATAHLQFGSGKGLLWAAAIDTFVLSMVLVYLREKTDSLWASMIVHAIKNAIAFLSLFILHLG